MLLTAVLLPVFVLCCAIVVDVGYWWANGKKAQIAADACALAAARDLPQDWDPARIECQFGGRDYVLENLPRQVDPADGARHTGTEVFSPYEGDSSKVEATVHMRVRTFFGRYVGLGSIDLVRRAVAQKRDGTGDWAIYSHDFTGCDAGEGLEFDNGPGVSIDGRIHSNGRYHVNAGHPPDDDFWAKRGTLDKNTCVASLDPEPDGAAYGTGPEPRDFLPEDWVFEPWPVWYTPAQFNWPTCSGADFSAQQINIKNNRVELKKPTFGGPDRDIPHNGTIPPGIYCAKEAITTSGSNLTGRITLLSPQINTIGGSHLRFTPYAFNVLFFAIPNWNTGWAPDTNPANDGTFPAGNPTCTNPDIELIINAGVVEWAGTIFHPCGRVVLNSAVGIGGNPALVGTIVGYKVKLNQADFEMIGRSDFGDNIALALVE